MRTFSIDVHHAILYGVLAGVSLAGLGVLHTWRMDLERTKIKTAADEKTIQAAERSKAERAKQYEAKLAVLESMRVTPKTPPAVIVTRLERLEPEMNVLPDQLVAPMPDAPKSNLVLDPTQQVILVNRLVECHECDKERDKLRGDVTDAGTKLKAMTDERDTWKQTAQGGSLKTRLKRRAWHFVEDAIAIELLRAIGGHP